MFVIMGSNTVDKQEAEPLIYLVFGLFVTWVQEAAGDYQAELMMRMGKCLGKRWGRVKSIFILLVSSFAATSRERY